MVNSQRHNCNLTVATWLKLPTIVKRDVGRAIRRVIRGAVGRAMERDVRSCQERYLSLVLMDLSAELGAKVCKSNRSDIIDEKLLGIATDCI